MDVHTISYFYFTYMNGLYQSNILVRETDNIFIPFEYEYYKTCPNVTGKNIIIDNRYDKELWKQILINGLDVLIYNSSRHRVCNIFQYFEDAYGIQRINLSLTKIRKACLIFIMIRHVFPKLRIPFNASYIIANIDNSEIIKMNILVNLCSISVTNAITSGQYRSIRNKVINLEPLTEPLELQKSFIIMFSEESILLSGFLTTNSKIIASNSTITTVNNSRL